MSTSACAQRRHCSSVTLEWIQRAGTQVGGKQERLDPELKGHTFHVRGEPPRGRKGEPIRPCRRRREKNGEGRDGHVA